MSTTHPPPSPPNLEEMPDSIQQKLAHLVASKLADGFEVQLVRIYPGPPNGTNKYWRANILLNNVRTKWYYSPTKEKWTRS